jgi:hypothetical protein
MNLHSSRAQFKVPMKLAIAAPRSCPAAVAGLGIMRLIAICASFARKMQPISLFGGKQVIESATSSRRTPELQNDASMDVVGS